MSVEPVEFSPSWPIGDNPGMTLCACLRCGALIDGTDPDAKTLHGRWHESLAEAMQALALAATFPRQSE